MKKNTQEKSPIKQRILLFLEEKGITQYEFYKSTGVTRGILGQNNGISEDNIARFLDYYRDINIEWLMTGKGEMQKTKCTPKSHQAQESPDNEDKVIKKQVIEQDISPVILNHFLSAISEKDATIREQAEEIGSLKEQIRQLEKENERLASVAAGSGIANAG